MIIMRDSGVTVISQCCFMAEQDFIKAGTTDSRQLPFSRDGDEPDCIRQSWFDQSIGDSDRVNKSRKPDISSAT